MDALYSVRVIIGEAFLCRSHCCCRCMQSRNDG